ncbi:MAG: DUF4342 domain-containing protein [Bacteroidales bacterium]
MEPNSWWEKIEAKGGELVDMLKNIVHEGNVRRIVIKQGDRNVAEFPLTVGLVGTVAAPVLAAAGALIAMLAECSIEVERVGPRPTAPAPPPGPMEPTDPTGTPS